MTLLIIFTLFTTAQQPVAEENDILPPPVSSPY